MMPPLLTFKFVSIVLIFAAGALGVWAAERIEELSCSSVATHFTNTFAGGVFLGAGLLHLMADSEATFRAAMPHVDFPVVTLLAGLGFLGILLLDKVCFVKDHHDAEAFAGRGTVYPFVLMVALSLHSVVTGIAFGLENHAIVATAILIAVLAHKSTASMAIAVGFSRANIAAGTRRVLLFMFCCMTPLGVAIGAMIGVAQQGPGAALTAAIFDGLAGGSFLYVAIVNILSEEFSNTTRRVELFVATIIGFSAMAALAIWS